MLESLKLLIKSVALMHCCLTSAESFESITRNRAPLESFLILITFGRGSRGSVSNMFLIARFALDSMSASERLAIA